MKNFKKIALFAGILLAMLFLANQKTEAAVRIQVELPGQYSEEGLHALAALQPESTHQLSSSAKSNGCSAIKAGGFSELSFTAIPQQNIRKTFYSQDINRCESVSLLLFPFHIFW